MTLSSFVVVACVGSVTIGATSATLAKEKVGRCVVIDESEFPKFDLPSFSDGQVGRCLLEKFAPDVAKRGRAGVPITKVRFLGREYEVNIKVSAALRIVEREILSSSYPGDKQWVKSFKPAGGFVPLSPLGPLLKKCQEAGPTMWIVRNKDSNVRLLTRIMNVLNGNRDGTLMDVLDALGLAIDVRDEQDRDLSKDEPIATRIPPSVLNAFERNGFVWYAEADPRQPRRFQYYGGDYYGERSCLGIVVPDYFYKQRIGCCVRWPEGSRAPSYVECLRRQGGEDSYDRCLGYGKPGNVWVEKPNVRYPPIPEEPRFSPPTPGRWGNAGLIVKLALETGYQSIPDASLCPSGWGGALQFPGFGLVPSKGLVITLPYLHVAGFGCAGKTATTSIVGTILAGLSMQYWSGPIYLEFASGLGVVLGNDPYPESVGGGFRFTLGVPVTRRMAIQASSTLFTGRIFTNAIHLGVAFMLLR